MTGTALAAPDQATEAVGSPAPLAVRAAERLLTRPPAENDGLVLARLGEIAGAPILMEFDYAFPVDGPCRRFPTRVHRPRGVTAAAIAGMRRVLDLAMAPAPRDTLIVEAGLMRVKAIQRAESRQDTQAYVAAMVEELMAYPADVAVTALRARWHHPPTADELLAKADALVASRRALVRAVGRWEPWTPADEVADLERAWRDALYHAANAQDPDLASAAAEARDAFAAELERVKAAAAGEGP